MPGRNVRAEDYNRRADWYVSKGISFAKALSAMRDSYSRVLTKTFESYYDEKVAVKRSGQGFRQRKDSSRIQISQLPTLVKNPRAIRITVNYKFSNPVTGRLQTHRDTFDFPAGMTKASINQSIRQQLVDSFSSMYATRRGGRINISRRIRDMSVSGLEAI